MDNQHKTQLYCGTLLQQGVKSVANKQRRNVRDIQGEIGQSLLGGYSGDAIAKWSRGHIPGDFVSHVEKLVQYCVTYGFVGRSWAQSLLIQARHPAPGDVLARLFADAPRSRIFLCYAGNVQPDSHIAQTLSEKLRQHHHIFFDQAQQASPDGIALSINELKQADFVIALLSARSIADEMLLFQLEEIHRLRETNSGRPLLFTVRLAYAGTFPEPTETYLDHSSLDIIWRTIEDTPRLVEDIRQAILGKMPIAGIAKQPRQTDQTIDMLPPLPLASRLPLEMPEGTMSPDSAFYIEREADRIARQAMLHPGVTITIKGPRQTGKSSLLARLMASGKNAGKHVIFLDFQQMQPTHSDFETFLRQFCSAFAYYLDAAAWEELDEKLTTYWRLPLPAALRCTEYIRHCLLTHSDRTLLLAIDEVDNIYDTDFRNSFFGMLRSWHNGRALESVWKHLDLALVSSTEPYGFINDLHQSPFNVGVTVSLTNFTLAQVSELNRRHHEPLNSNQLARLMSLLQGHPYLVRRALYLLARQEISAPDFFRHAAEDDGPYGDHLRRHLLNLYLHPALRRGFQQVLHEQRCDDHQVFWRLQGAGLVRQEEEYTVIPSCQLYADFFAKNLHD